MRRGRERWGEASVKLVMEDERRTRGERRPGLNRQATGDFGRAGPKTRRPLEEPRRTSADHMQWMSIDRYRAKADQCVQRSLNGRSCTLPDVFTRVQQQRGLKHSLQSLIPPAQIDLRARRPSHPASRRLGCRRQRGPRLAPQRATWAEVCSRLHGFLPLSSTCFFLAQGRPSG